MHCPGVSRILNECEVNRQAGFSHRNHICRHYDGWKLIGRSNLFPIMKPPTPDQAKWAADSWDCVTQTYDEWTRDGFHDFTPMLRLIDHIRTSCDADLLSAGTSLVHLCVASAAHVSSPNRLADDAPAICVTQGETEFEFRDAEGKRRRCPFDQAAAVFDAQLVRLGMMVDAYDPHVSGQH